MANPISNALSVMGEYTLLMAQVFRRPKKWGIFFKQLIREMAKYGLDSIWIVVIISFFIGTVITIQLTINMNSPLIPHFTIGYASREIMFLEFSSSIMCLILAGKVGSSIASELATMRVTEQIDAMEIMGVNSANFLILPKILGLMLFIPVLSVISMSTGLVGGYLATSLVYAFIISSGASYFGYTVKGGALGVGRASTNAVVSSCVLILLADVVLTSLLFM